MFSEISINVWIVAAGVLCAATVVVFFRFKKDRSAKLVYQWNGRIVVGKEKEELPDEITNAMKIAGSPYISLSEIAIWNAGRQPIRGSEIDSSDPLRITLSQGTKILQIHQRSKTDAAISFVVTLDPDRPNLAFCSFDSLGPREGVRLQFFETGFNYGVNLNGTVRGLPDGITNWGRGPIGDSSSVPTSKMARYSPYFSIAYIALAIVLIPVGFLVEYARHGHDTDFQLLTFGNSIRILNVVFWIWFVARAGISQHRARYGRYPKSLADD